MTSTLPFPSPRASSPRASRPHRAVAIGVIGVGLVALCDIGLLVAGVLPWSFPVAMLAAGLLVSASMAVGFELAREATRRGGDRHASDLSGLAHDIRTPLHTTRTLLQLVESGSLGALTAEASDALARAAIAASRAEALLLDSLGAGTPQPPAASGVRALSANVDEALDHAIDALRSRIEESQAVIERGVLPMVQADPLALERALTNLLLNAITHSSPDVAPRIRVSAASEGGRCVLTVSDNGPGIPASLLDSAFDPGVRGFSARQSPGFGLGLSTVRRLVEQQGGRAWIDPASNEGASIRLELPAA